MPLQECETLSSETAQLGSRVSTADIHRALGTYPEHNRFIQEATYAKGALTAWARKFPHPLHEPWVEHLTREHALIYTTQASYLLIQAAIDAGDFPYLSADHYSYVCRSEEGVISKVAVRFRRTASVPARVKIQAAIVTARTRRGAVYVQCRYQIADICTVEAWLTSPIG
jgi:hypothetical protein